MQPQPAAIGQRGRRRVTCCLDGNLCRTVVIFVVQVVSLILTPLILIFINEAINPVVVAISIAFLLLLILSLVCTMICRCLYLKSRVAQSRRANNSRTFNTMKGSGIKVASGAVAAAGKSSCRSLSNITGVEAKNANTARLDDSPVHGLCPSRTCVTILSHEYPVGSPDSNPHYCSCATDPWELQQPGGSAVLIQSATAIGDTPDVEAGDPPSVNSAAPAYAICYPEGDRSFV